MIVWEWEWSDSESDADDTWYKLIKHILQCRGGDCETDQPSFELPEITHTYHHFQMYGDNLSPRISRCIIQSA